MLDLDAFDRLCRIKDAEKPAPMQQTPAEELNHATKINNDWASKLTQNAHMRESKRELEEEPQLKRYGDAVDKESMHKQLCRAMHLDRMEDLAPEKEHIPDCDLLMDELDQQMEEIALRRVVMTQKQGWARLAVTAAALVACVSILRELSYW
ncbi:unnamed protein product [Clonostachys rhizophaga]|uniref:Uncharacterized protein n=1 Tax=Clonostachys rhizophaga TaxID=160324 RepID=A0A9N9YDE5_9HYPO|nr:unnamed protein product [Clonostachys rhizophaga]